jgi:hypothetical protein
MAETEVDTDEDWTTLGAAPEAAPLTEVVDEPFDAASQRARLRSLEDDLLERTLRIIDGAMHFDEIDDPADGASPEAVAAGVDDSLAIPEDWVRELGFVKAQRRMRMARAAWKGAKDGPVGLKLASQVFNGIVKARATEKAAPAQLNVISIQMTAPLPVFERMKVERE